MQDWRRWRTVTSESGRAAAGVARPETGSAATFLRGGESRRPRSDIYSVLLNSAMAIAVIPTPITATMPSDSHSGTTQPAQVMLGAR
jgi:hypothetical protein